MVLWVGPIPEQNVCHFSGMGGAVLRPSMTTVTVVGENDCHKFKGPAFCHDSVMHTGQESLQDLQKC